MVGLSVFFALGVWLLQQQAALPDIRWAFLLIPLFAAIRLRRSTSFLRTIRISILLLLATGCGFFYAAWLAQQRLAV